MKNFIIILFCALLISSCGLKNLQEARKVINSLEKENKELIKDNKALQDSLNILGAYILEQEQEKRFYPDDFYQQEPRSSQFKIAYIEELEY